MSRRAPRTGIAAPRAEMPSTDAMHRSGVAAIKQRWLIAGKAEVSTSTTTAMRVATMAHNADAITSGRGDPSSLRDDLRERNRPGGEPW